MKKRIIFTGGPTCGKSTIIDLLDKRGYETVKEVAREVINERRGYEATKEEWEIRQRIIFERTVFNEENISEGYTFFDRSAIDGLAYSRFYGLDISKEAREFDFSGRYNKVFLLERLPFEDDGLRTEGNDENAQKVHDLIIEEYEVKGYSLINIPVMKTPEERLELILKKVFE